MKRHFTLNVIVTLLTTGICTGQDYEPEPEAYHIRTVFRSGQHASGGYGAIGNKFTTIGGKFANMPEVYGGWFINHKFMIGIGAAATTNFIEVPVEYSTQPGVDMSYAYGQAGIMLEYTLWSHRALHFSFQLFNGGAFTCQYERTYHDENHYWDNVDYDHGHDVNFFYVSEPGVKVELNIFKWMRFCPGVSYRAAFGSDGIELKDKDLSGVSMNFTLKFGRF